MCGRNWLRIDGEIQRIQVGPRSSFGGVIGRISIMTDAYPSPEIINEHLVTSGRSASMGMEKRYRLSVPLSASADGAALTHSAPCQSDSLNSAIECQHDMDAIIASV